MNQKRIIILLFLANLPTISTLAQEAGMIPKETKVGKLTYRKKMHYVRDKAGYVNGGITFYYPAGTFSTPPTVNVSLELNVPLDTETAWSPVIVANDATSSTIAVIKSTPTEHREATADEINVIIYAVG